MAKRKRPHVNDAKQIANRSQYIQLSSIRLMCSLIFNHVKPESPLPIYAGEKSAIKACAGSNDREFAAIVDLGISVGYKEDHEFDKDSSGDPIKISATFLLLYSIESDGLSQREIEAFVSTMALEHVWPYWREYVQSMTTRMGFPAMTIPILSQRPIGVDTEAHPIKKRTKGKSSSRK
jgi:hypothetical protein